MALQNYFKPKSVDSTGFSAKPQFEGSRLMNKEGSFFVVKKGIPFSEKFSFFHFLITVSWIRFTLLGILAFTLANISFTVLYFWLDHEHQFSGLPKYEHEWEHFLYLFYFSVQTFTTVGYGNVAPIGKMAGLISSIEALTGLCSMALMSGILYGRFSKPEPKLKYSQIGLISPYLDGKAFMFRLANIKNSDMTEVEAKVVFSSLELNEKGENVRKFYPLTLEFSKISFLPTSWTVVHAINSTSPLSNLHQEDFEKKDVEFLVQIMGYDETYNQTVHSRTSYKYTEIIWNAKFEIILGTTDDGIATVDLSRISHYKHE